MKLEKRIYCIEGHWGSDKREVEPSVEPMLQLLHGLGQWEYARRDCATVEELVYFLDAEWCRCQYGSILYVATHGAPGEIHLSTKHAVTLEQLAVHLSDFCGDCLVHFGGCEVLNVPNSCLKDFMEETGAMGVSGYTVEAGWTSVVDSSGGTRVPVPGAPALALELLFFSTLATEKVDLTKGKLFRRLRRVADDLIERFPDCGFRMLTRLD